MPPPTPRTAVPGQSAWRGTLTPWKRDTADATKLTRNLRPCRAESLASVASRGTVEHILHPPADERAHGRHRHGHDHPDPVERSYSSGVQGMASQEASFLSNAAGNGPRISERRSDGQAQDQSEVDPSGPVGESGSKPHSARSRARKSEEGDSQVSFHVNPNFGEEVSDSDVLVNAHASHNAGHRYPHGGQPVRLVASRTLPV